jgi:hypothetical protein
MSAKYLATIALLCALVAQSSQAAPTMSVVHTGLNAGNREWLVSITPDATLFDDNPPNGFGGSVAVELAFTIDDPTELLSVVIADPISWPNANPGNSPWGGFCCGTQLDLVNDRAFTAYGSAYFTTGTPKQFIKITTAGSGPSTLNWLGAYNGFGRMAQAGQNFDLYKGTVSVVPEPASIVMLGFAGFALVLGRRSR